MRTFVLILYETRLIPAPDGFRLGAVVASEACAAECQQRQPQSTGRGQSCNSVLYKSAVPTRTDAKAQQHSPQVFQRHPFKHTHSATCAIALGRWQPFTALSMQSAYHGRVLQRLYHARVICNLLILLLCHCTASPPIRSGTHTNVVQL